MKEKALELWEYLRRTLGVPAMIVIVLFSGYFIYITISEWRLASDLDRQAKRIDEYSRQSQASIAETNQYLANFEKNHLATLSLLETVQGLSENIRGLADADRTISVRVDGMRNDYESARNQKRNTFVQPNIPVRSREDRALSADAQLYPE